MKKLGFKLESNLELTLKKINNKHLFFIKNSTTGLSTWFYADTLSNTKSIERTIKKGIHSVSLGHQRKLVLKGVGFKGTVNDNVLSLRIGKREAAEYIIPKNVYITVIGNTVLAWSPDVSITNNFFHKILRKTPVRKGTIVYEK
jgi:ribosomal protein L6P/L9E